MDTLVRFLILGECFQCFTTENNVCCRLITYETSLVAQMVKHLPTMLETQDQTLGREDLLEKEMVTHSSILAWKIPWMEKPGRLQSMGSQRVEHDWVTSLSFFLSVIHGLYCVEVGSFYAHLLKSFHHKWVLILSKAFSASLEMLIWFLILQYVNMLYHIDWFWYIKECLHCWNKPNLIMMLELFDVLLNSVC